MVQYGAGKAKSNLSDFWQTPAKGVRGGTDGTPKTDMYNSDYNISLKKKGGSQLASGGKGETIATFHAALEYLGKQDGDSPEIDNIVHVRGHAETGAFHMVKITEVNEYELIGDIVS